MKKLTHISHLDLTDWSGKINYKNDRPFILINSFAMPVTSEQAQELQFLSGIQCSGDYKIGEFSTPYWSEHDLNPTILGSQKIHERDFPLTLFLEEYGQKNKAKVGIALWNDFVDNFKIEVVTFGLEDKNLEVIKLSLHEFFWYMLDGIIYPSEIPMT